MMSDHKCSYDDGICKRCHEQESKPDHSELITEITAWINAPLDKRALIEEYDLQVCILLTDVIKALKGEK